MGVYYNENDADAVAWLRELISRGLVAQGDVDDRSIEDVRPDDLRGYAQCHFFSGIGTWSYALRLAGWPDDRPIWTGSCPCQPFSVSGNGLGFDDPRDLWPHFVPLVRARRPPVVMGELTAKKAGRAWLDRARSDLEDGHYASRGVVVPSCAVDAPNERERLYWCAIDVEHAAVERRRKGRTEPVVGSRGNAASGADAPRDMGDADAARLAQREGERGDPCTERAAAERADDPAGFWDDHEWIVCHDGRSRRTKPGIPLLAAGSAARIPMWRGLGNAINARLAAEAIRAFMESDEGKTQ